MTCACPRQPSGGSWPLALSVVRAGPDLGNMAGPPRSGGLILKFGLLCKALALQNVNGAFFLGVSVKNDGAGIRGDSCCSSPAEAAGAEPRAASQAPHGGRDGRAGGPRPVGGPPAAMVTWDGGGLCFSKAVWWLLHLPGPTGPCCCLQGGSRLEGLSSTSLPTG